MEAAVLEKWAGLEKWLRSRKQPVCGLACHVPSQPQKGVIEVLGLGKEEVEGFRLGDLFCWDFRELTALCKVQISQQSSVYQCLGWDSPGRSSLLQTEGQFKGSTGCSHKEKQLSLP